MAGTPGRSGRKRSPVLALVHGGKSKGGAKAKAKAPVDPKRPPLTIDDCPRRLGDDEREMFAHVLRVAPPGLLRRTDANIVADYANTLTLEERAIQELGRDDLVVISGQGTQSIHPLARLLNQLSMRRVRIESELGFTPAARSRAPVVAEDDGDQGGGEFDGL
jgi:P27 family predicted phage terminase small subunit